MTTTQAALSIPRLRAELAGHVVGPDDPGYDDARSVFSPAADRRPAAIVRPRDAAEVARVVSLARETGLELAVRSGGHSVAGHGTSDGGIVCDLSALKALEVDAERRVVRAQAGLTAGEVTAAAGEHGLAVPFGDTGSVGIGGLTLGGGIGLLARLHGLTIDGLLAAELVTADGELLLADEEHHPDLFWAIRGGGGNFGVATRFAYRAHPVATVTGGMLLLPATAETVAGFVAAADEAPGELSAIASVMPAPPLPFVPEEHRGRLALVALVVHAGPPEAGEPVLAPFRALAAPLADLVRPLPYADLFPPEQPPRAFSAIRTLFLEHVDAPAADTILERIRASTAQMPAVQLRVLGGAVSRVPADATAYAHRSSRIMANVAAMYAAPGEGPEHEAWAHETAAALRQGDDGAYVNFLGDEGEERVRAAYPGRTWDRLAAVKRRYDPDNVFRLNENVPPAREFG